MNLTYGNSTANTHACDFFFFFVSQQSPNCFGNQRTTGKRTIKVHKCRQMELKKCESNDFQRWPWNSFHLRDLSMCSITVHLCVLCSRLSVCEYSRVNLMPFPTYVLVGVFAKLTSMPSRFDVCIKIVDGDCQWLSFDLPYAFDNEYVMLGPSGTYDFRASNPPFQRSHQKMFITSLSSSQPINTAVLICFVYFFRNHFLSPSRIS